MYQNMAHFNLFQKFKRKQSYVKNYVIFSIKFCLFKIIKKWKKTESSDS